MKFQLPINPFASASVSWEGAGFDHRGEDAPFLTAPKLIGLSLAHLTVLCTIADNSIYEFRVACYILVILLCLAAWFVTFDQ